MAQIINRKTPEIIAMGRAIGVDYITVMERGFYFTKHVCVKLGVKADRYIHFVNDNNFWIFYINSDSDGFTFTPDKDGSFVVNSKALSNMFINSTGKKINDKLLITPTKSRQEERNIIYEINTKQK